MSQQRGNPLADADAIEQLLDSPAVQRVKERRRERLLIGARNIDLGDPQACVGMLAAIQAEEGVWADFASSVRTGEQIVKPKAEVV